METTLETKGLRVGDGTGELAAGDWRRRWRFGSWVVEATVETWQLGNGNDV